MPTSNEVYEARPGEEIYSEEHRDVDGTGWGFILTYLGCAEGVLRLGYRELTFGEPDEGRIPETTHTLYYSIGKLKDADEIAVRHVVLSILSADNMVIKFQVIKGAEEASATVTTEAMLIPPREGDTDL